MLLSVDWLKEFTPYDGSLDNLAHCLTMLGLEVEEQRQPFPGLEQVVAGTVIDCQPHPNADTLSLCRVDAGGEPLTIVCGAPNVSAGQGVAVAPAGSRVGQDLDVQACEIRGVTSQGMLLSEKELGLGEDHSGIMVFDEEQRPGQSLTECLRLDSTLFDIGVTPNRSDCLSVLGIAREVAAYFDLPLQLPRISLQESDPETASQISVGIDDPELCPLYQARLIQDIAVRPSPAWMRYRLLGLGFRPINAIVDITNYVLLELGQPLHAFDRRLIDDDCIRVARAKQDQSLTTLDGQARTLSSRDLLIWDGRKPVALAGIMGGQNSEIQPDSREVLLECAVFEPSAVRHTARRLNVSSESAYRFERGVDQPGSILALNRAAGLMQELTGGRVARGMAKSEPRPWKPARITFRPERAESLLAMDVDEDFCSRTLDRLNCDISQSSAGAWRVSPPSYRLDLLREEDLIEEIGRFFGFERIPAKLPRIAKQLEKQPEPDQDHASYAFLKRIKAWAQGLGYREVINFSFVGSGELAALGLNGEDCLRVHNPLSETQDTMRPLLAPGLLNNLRLNIDQDNRDLRCFEVARTFQRNDASETMAEENTRLGLILHGRRSPDHWPWAAEDADYAELKGTIEHLLRQLSCGQAEFRQTKQGAFLDPDVAIELQGRTIGFVGKLRRDLAKGYHVRKEAWLAELDLDQLFRLHSGTTIAYAPWAKFPPVMRDMTVIAGPETAYAQIETAIQDASESMLERLQLIDIYQPEGSKERNLTLRMTYRDPNRTLTDSQVDERHNALAEYLVRSLPLRFP